jgi:hypothetical protein
VKQRFAAGLNQRTVYSTIRRELQTLKDMQTPENGANLYQFITAMNG